jgi:hypothetical protein
MRLPSGVADLTCDLAEAASVWRLLAVMLGSDPQLPMLVFDRHGRGRDDVTRPGPERRDAASSLMRGSPSAEVASVTDSSEGRSFYFND